MTIQIRLSLLFAVVVETLLGMVFLVLYFTIAADRKQDFFEQLEVKALTVADVFFNADELDRNALNAARKSFRGILSSSQVIILDSVGHCIYINDSAFAERLSLFQPIALDSALYSFLSPAAIASARQGSVLHITNNATHTLYLLHPEQNNNYLIIVRAHDETGEQLLADMRFVLFIAAGCVPFIAFAIGLWFSRNALAPVTTMINSANAISLQRLSTRLEEGNGRDEISHLAQAFNQMLVRLDTAYKVQRQFIDHASHELRTPLTIMEGEIGVALFRERSPETYRTSLRSLHTTVQRLSRLTTNLLLLAKIESGAVTQTFKAEMFDEILFHAIDDLRSRYPNRAIITEPDTITDLLENVALLCNRELLHTALVNVMDNAVKFSPDKCAVRIQIALFSNQIFCAVVDTGIGIHEEELQHIFTPFYRSQQAANVGGTGIGLAMVRAILEAHNGAISIQSSLSEGTVVLLSLHHL